MLLGATAVVETVQLIESGQTDTVSQDDALATPAPKVFASEARIPWAESDRVVHNHIRGLSPNPGAFTLHGDDRLKLYRSRIVPEPDAVGEPGTVLTCDGELVVKCGQGSVLIEEIQAPGKRRMDTDLFLSGYSISKGDLLK